MSETFNPADMISTNGFINRYFQNLKKARTNEEAYEITAKEYKEAFGIEKYSCYDSFRRVKNRKHKRN